MPPICFHMGIALDAASHLPPKLTGGVLGAYLFGSTLPDMHIITQTSRQDTHFRDLDQSLPQAGVELFLQKYSHLSPRSVPEPLTAGLVAGYLSHLITDEAWVGDIYCPLFSASSPLRDEPLANIMDRALQYELDRREREDEVRVARIRSLLASFPPEMEAGLAAPSSLRQWHSFVMAALERTPRWENFAGYVERFLIPQSKVTPQELSRFMASLPANLEKILNYVTPQRLKALRERSVSASAAAAREYFP